MCRPSMKRRKPGHDYRGAAIYMITLTIQDRKPLLGELFYDSDSLFRENPNAYVKYSLFGRKVKRVWNKIPFLYPQIQTWRCEIMPDHIHGILYVKERLRIHLSEVITGYSKEEALPLTSTRGSARRGGWKSIRPFSYWASIRRLIKVQIMSEYLRRNMVHDLNMFSGSPDGRYCLVRKTEKVQ